MKIAHSGSSTWRLHWAEQEYPHGLLGCGENIPVHGSVSRSAPTFSRGVSHLWGDRVKWKLWLSYSTARWCEEFFRSLYRRWTLLPNIRKTEGNYNRLNIPWISLFESGFLNSRTYPTRIGKFYADKRNCSNIFVHPEQERWSQTTTVKGIARTSVSSQRKDQLHLGHFG